MNKRVRNLLLSLFLVGAATACNGGSDNTVTDVRGTEDSADGTGIECTEAIQCDDGDPCTDDLCSDGLCSNEPKACDDGLFCNGLESCDPTTGECLVDDVPVLDDGVLCTVDSCDEDADKVVHAPDDPGCDDGDPCTTDTCDPESGCVSEFNTDPCDDGDPCTIDDACTEGTCAGTAKPCDDGLFCNGLESCDPDTGECLLGTPPEVDDGVECTEDSCDEENDEVVHEPDATPCDDDNPCTDDICDPDVGCTHKSNTEPCDDGLLCTVDDVCSEGVCAGFSKECDDGVFCNGAEACDDETGECLPGTPPLLDDGFDCTIDSCDEEDDVVLHEPDNALCDDGDLCTDNVCDVEQGCLFPYNTAPCDDADPCTVEDTCAQGLCAGAPKDCSDGLFCNGMESCEPDTGDCLAGAVPELADAFDCTNDSCDEENDLVVHTPDDGLCDDENPCTDDLCDPEAGCQHTFNTAACDDGDPCTVEDVCAEGVCAGAAKVCDDGLFCNGVESCDPETGDCLPGTPPDPDDGIECTTDACDEETDELTHAGNHAACDDQNPCTDDTCDLEQGCLHADNTVACDDNDLCTLDDVCADGNCAGTPKVCDDGLFCNGEESCNGDSGDCVDGPAPVVDDGFDCTVDSCDEENDVILHAPDDALCDDENPCTDDACDPDAGCTYKNNEAPCTDGDECTDGDLCGGGECMPGTWVCEDCTNQDDDNNDGLVDCCDPLCVEETICQAEADCADEIDNDCDGLNNCEDMDCFGDEACGPYPQAGDLVITEIMQNPEAVTDVNGEWFELYNGALETFDLRFMEVVDAEGSGFQVEASLPIGPGEYLVFGRNGDALTNGGVTVDYEYSGFPLGNADDEVILSVLGSVVDEVAYDGGPDFPAPVGASMQLDVEHTDATANDDGQYWCLGTTSYGDGESPDLGSPGDENTSCFELECNDQTDNDGDGLVDCEDPDCVAAENCLDSDDDGVLDGEDQCPGKDDKVDVDEDDIPDGCEIQWAGLAWPNSGTSFDDDDDVVVYLQVYMTGVTEAAGPGLGIIPKVKYRAESNPNWVEVQMPFNAQQGNNDEYKATIPSFVTLGGESFLVDFTLTYQTDDVANAYNGATITDQAMATVPLAYPITLGALPPAAGELVITEIFQNPSAVADNMGEWIELYNAADHALNLQGVVLSDADGESHTITNAVVFYPGQYVLLGNNGDKNTNGGVILNYTYSDFVLGNGADEVILTGPSGEIDRVDYDGGPNFPDPNGRTMSLDPAAFSTVANDDGGNWCEASTTFGAGDYGSPGQDNPDC